MKNKTLNIRGRLCILEKPVVMGILNATPDSFYAVPESKHLDSLMTLANQMIEEGAFMLDVGGMSTNPKSVMIPVEAEWQRLSVLLKELRKNFSDVLISVDTFRAEVARRAADFGVDIINDISAGEMDAQMFRTVAELGLPYIAMHMQGTPQTMQLNPKYENVTRDILNYFIRRIEEMEMLGIKDIIIDPGFGFGKTIEHNYQLLKELNLFSLLEKPLLVGISRKSMIYKYLGIQPQDALNGTTALNILALQNGASILRVHDVKEAVECIRLWEKIQ